MTKFLIGTGGWAYFKGLNRPSLKAYAEVFGFVEVNFTFYDYPDPRLVHRWRSTVSECFTFAVRCHQDLTHRIGLRPVKEAYQVFDQLISYCKILDAPFLVLTTPHSYVINQENAILARDFFASTTAKSVRLVWEIRAPLTSQALDLMQSFNIVHCMDLSKEEPGFESDVVYTRLFGKGKHNIYQFTDEELVQINREVIRREPRTAVLSYHGVRMNTDAIRFVQYKKTGEFLPTTSSIGLDSVREVLSEDARFPSHKKSLIKDQGWKVVDWTPKKRIHLSELLHKIPETNFENLEELMETLEVLQ